ncbi:MAG: hypothetical protein LBV26_05775, partial [Bacteroidales bacterium]|nr:hypothetical protein [Bacteroidales bacterium]
MSILNIKEMFRAKAGRFIALFSLFFLTAAAALAQTPVWSVAPTVTNVNGGLNITLNYAVDNFGTAGKVYVAILPGNFPANQWNSNQIKNRINAGTYEGVVLDVTDNGAQSHVITLGNFIASQEYTVFFVAEGESGNNHAYNPEAAYFTTNTCPQPDVWYNFNQGGKCVNVGATAYFSAQAQTGQLRTDPNYTGIYEGTVWEMDWGDGTKTTFTSSVDNEVPPPPDEGSPWLHTYAYLEGLCAVEARITITNRCGMSFTTFINVELHGPEDLDYGDGDVVIAPAAPWEVNDAGVIEVCEGKESVVTLLDNSIWNCLAPVLGKPNSSRRDIQWFYGVEPARGAWNATGAIQNTIHGAVAVGSLGNATATAGRYGQRINGIQSAGTASDAITIPETAEAGDYFWVYLKYWNDCNRADDKYVSERIQILVVDAPAAPTVSSRTICLEDITTPPASPDARTLTVTSAPAGTLTWYSDANLTASSVVATGTAYTPNVTAPGTYTYYVTDQSVDGLKCISEATKVTLTVRETLPRPGIITANPAYICNGANATFSVAAAPADMPFGGPTQYRWEVPAGWKINSGQGTRSINVTAGTVDGEHTVKVFREYTTAPNCPSQERTVTVTVYPFPTVNSPATDLACSGKLFIYNATGEKQGQGRTLPAGTYRYNFKWSRSVVTGINNGLGAGQSGSIQETLNNITTQPVTVIYQITPTIVRPDGLAACEGDPFTLRVTVAPNADIKAKDAEICSGETASKTPVHSDADRVPPNTTYSWVPKADVTGVSDFEAGNSGAGNSISVAPKNNTSEVKEVIYTVTPTTKTTTALGTIECEGTSFDFTVKINPTPSIQRIDKTICSGETFTVVPVDGTDGIVPSNTTYTWTLYSSSQWSNVDGESPQNNPVTSISNTLTNRTNANVTVRYVVTPKSGDCSGTPFHIWVVVNPKPDIGNFERETCSGVAFTAVKPVNGTDGIVPTSTRYTWSEPVLENSGALTGGQAGTGNNLTQITGTLTNTTNIPQKATYTVTPRSGNCTGETFDIVVTVNPKPFVKAEPINVCSGKEFKLEPANGGTNNNIIPVNTTYTWSAPTVPTGDVLEGGASGSNAATITGTLTNN